MIYSLLALHGLAQERGEGLHPTLAEGLRKIQRFDDARLIAIDGGAVRKSEKDASQGSEQTAPGTVRRLTSL